MDQERIGTFIREARQEKGMTQKDLAERIGVTDRAVSNWENGRRLPDYSIVDILCKSLDISINELFAGCKLREDDFKDAADKNLLEALSNSSFTLKEKIEFYKRKWQREHFFGLTLWMLVIIFFIIYGFIKDNDWQYLAMIIGLISGVVENNRMMAYIESHVYGSESEDIDSKH